MKVYTPAEIVEFLDQYVIGQDDAKRVLGVAVYNHYKRINFMENNQNADGIEIKKSNVMMLGPTGSGKTLLVTTLARLLKATLVLGDATSIVAAEDVGDQINRLFIKLLEQSNGDPKVAERGIIFVDEVDKLVTGVNRLKGESIQQILLKVIEGTIINVQYQNQIVKLDTNNILFVVGGAFVDLPGIVRTRLGERESILLDDFAVLKQVVADDFANFGMIPEFMGRIPIVVVLQALSKLALRDALIKPKNSLISQYKKMLEVEQVEIEFEDSSIDKIAEMAEALQTGARGLRTICERFMTNIMFDIPNETNLTKIIITPAVIEGKGKPIYIYNVSRSEENMKPLTPKKPRGTSAYTDEGEIDDNKY